MKTTKLKIVLNSSNLNIIPDYILDSLNRDVVDFSPSYIIASS